VRIIRIAAYGILLVFCACSLAWSQGAPLSVEAFVEGGGSFIRNTEYPYISCYQIASSSSCPPPARFSNAGRVFTGVRFRTGHDAVEASYSYGDNQEGLWNRLDLFSFNYVRYLRLKSKVQPFATIGLGTSRFSGPSNPATSFKFVWNYGGGADIALRWRLALRLELRDYVGGQPMYFTGTSHNIVPSAGLVFRFK
jgi:opacity protein-like surface antigen